MSEGRNNTRAMRISTNYVNTVSDPVPGSLYDASAEGRPLSGSTYPDLVGQKFWLDKRTLWRHFSGTTNRPPGGVQVQYVLMDASSPVDAALGVLVFWKDRAALTVSAKDDGNYRLAGVLLGAVPGDGKYGYIAKVGEVYVKFLSSTTKGTPAAGDVAVTVSGNSAVADVLADATAQTYGTDNTNEKVGRLMEGVTSRFALCYIDIED
jgi:hypothetical protein